MIELVLGLSFEILCQNFLLWINPPICFRTYLYKVLDVKTKKNAVNFKQEHCVFVFTGTLKVYCWKMRISIFVNYPGYVIKKQ